MFDPEDADLAAGGDAAQGFMYTDPVAIQRARTQQRRADLGGRRPEGRQGLGLIEVRSVYDTDGLGRMGEGMLVDSDRRRAATPASRRPKPADSLDTRSSIADLVK